MYDTKTALKNYMNLKKQIVLDGLLVGIFAACFTVLYRMMLSFLDGMRHRLFQEFSPLHLIGILILFALLSLVVGYLIRFCPLSSGSGIPQIQGEMLGSIDMDEKKVLAAKFVGGGIANFAGLSLGREGPSIQIGGAAAKLLSKLLRKDANEERFIISAGASAGLAAAFNAPISGTIFALEEMHKNFSPLILIPCLIASIVADYLSKNVFGLDASFHFIHLARYLPLNHYLHIFGIGIFCGLIGILFNFLILKGQDLYKKLALPPLIKPLPAFLASALLGFALYDVLGGGHHLVEKIIHLPLSLEFLIVLLIVKLLFTALSYGSGSQGGIFLPVLVIGALCGAIYISFATELVQIDSIYFANFIVLGMAGILTAVVRSPILSIMLVTEMVGSLSHMLSFCIVAIVSYLTAEMFNSAPIYESLLERLLSSPLHKQDGIVQNKVITTFLIPINASICNRKIKDITFPKNTLIVSIQRGTSEFIPNGENTLLGGDEITVLCDKENLIDIKTYFIHL